MLKSAYLLHKCGLGDSDMSSTVTLIAGIHAESSEVIVEQVMDPLTMHDGDTFYGLYPKFPLPERCFSDDHIMYFTIKQVGNLRSIAVDINTHQVFFFI